MQVGVRATARAEAPAHRPGLLLEVQEGQEARRGRPGPPFLSTLNLLLFFFIALKPRVG